MNSARFTGKLDRLDQFFLRYPVYPVKIPTEHSKIKRSVKIAAPKAPDERSISD